MVSDQLLKAGATVVELGAVALSRVEQRASDSVEALQAYIEALDVWQGDFDGLIKAESQLSTEQLDVAKIISEQHNRIVDAVKEFHGDMGDSIKRLGSWMKGVRAYADSLPKRLSTMKPQKG